MGYKVNPTYAGVLKQMYGFFWEWSDVFRQSIRPIVVNFGTDMPNHLGMWFYIEKTDVIYILCRPTRDVPNLRGDAIYSSNQTQYFYTITETNFGDHSLPISDWPFGDYIKLARTSLKSNNPIKLDMTLVDLYDGKF